MLIEFRVSNFRSIKDEQVLSMVATKDTAHLETHTVETGIKAAPRLVKSAVIYGPNASGKSNLLFALQFMQGILRDSASIPIDGKYTFLQPFRLDRESPSAPTTFESTFLIDGVRYQYGFSLNQEKIIEEYLYVYRTAKPQLWFMRSYSDKGNVLTYKFSEALKGDKATWKNSTRHNALFLATAALLNSELLGPIYHWLLSNIIVVKSLPPVQIALEAIAKEDDLGGFRNYLLSADVGISSVDFEYKKGFRQGITFKIGQSGPAETQMVEEVEVPEFRFKHTSGTCEADFLVMDESDGTRKMIQLYPLMLDVINRKATIVVDELENSIHPLLVKAILGIFNDSANNPGGAQLVFTTHNVTMLDSGILRRDQIWFTEKDQAQATKLYPLTDFSPRKNEALESGYLSGRYGAIPFIGDFKFGG